MSTRSRTTLLILAAAVTAVFISGVILRGLIIADLEPFLKNTQTDNAEILLKRIGNFILLWSFCIAVTACACAFFIRRKTGGEVKRSSVVSAAQVPEQAQSEPFSPETQQATHPESAVEQEGKPLISISVKVEEEEPAADEQEDRLHVDDPDRLRKIIQGLDELARAEALGRTLQKQQLELALHLNDAVEKTRAAVSDKEIQFNLECENGLTMNADPDCLAKIILHLMDNAAKAVKDKGAVTLSAAAQNGHVLLSVRDTGIGIKRKDLPHIFERFYRASGSGIGLGLTIVRELVDACGGKIEVETTRGQGSQVTVRIPHA
jgi:two-component system, OmpR family, phosphate regulon sensor histidine kinase PhoR